MLINQREPLGVLLARGLVRMGWRHRSALAPVTVAVAVFIACAVARDNHREAWPIVPLVSVLMSVLIGIPHTWLLRHRCGARAARILARACAACGMDRAAERAYGAGVVAVIGAWSSAALLLGPATRPLPALWCAGTVLAGIPWWAHRRRRARVRVQRITADWPTLAESMGLPGSRIASAVVDAWGFTARLALRKGATVADATGRIASIESALGVRAGSVRILPDGARADRCVVRVVERDPHAQPLPWPPPETASITRPFILGLFEDAREVAVSFLRRHVLIGGVIGSGKSGIVNVILGTLAACADAVVWGVDLKEGMELAPWKPCLGRLATTGPEACELLRAAVEELERRARILTARGLRVWEPTAENPALVVIIDEYAELPELAREYADSIARRGRAVAVTLIAATQRPTQKTMGGATRSQMDIRICMRVRERRDADLILGQGMAKLGWNADSLTTEGSFLLSSPAHHAPIRARAYLVDDDAVTAHVARHAAHHPHPARPLGADQGPETGVSGPQTVPHGRAGDDHPHGPHTAADGPPGPDAALWAALRDAGPHGAPVGALMAASGRGRRWVYYRLREHARAGRAVQLARGRWRAVPAEQAARPPRAPRRAPSRPPNRDRK